MIKKIICLFHFLIPAPVKKLITKNISNLTKLKQAFLKYNLKYTGSKTISVSESKNIFIFIKIQSLFHAFELF